MRIIGFSSFSEYTWPVFHQHVSQVCFHYEERTDKHHDFKVSLANGMFTVMVTVYTAFRVSEVVNLTLPKF